MAKKTFDTIDLLIMEEIERANAKHGEKINSTHEGYAVLKEEIEECRDELSYLLHELDLLWINTRDDNDKQYADYLDEMAPHARQLITEAIQVAAMCKKVRGCMNV